MEHRRSALPLGDARILANLPMVQHCSVEHPPAKAQPQDSFRVHSHISARAGNPPVLWAFDLAGLATAYGDDRGRASAFPRIILITQRFDAVVSPYPNPRFSSTGPLRRSPTTKR